MDEHASPNRSGAEMARWTDAWQRLQSAYWTGWLDLGRSLGGAAGAGSAAPLALEPWLAGWRLWWEMLEAPPGRSPAESSPAAAWLRLWTDPPYLRFWQSAWGLPAADHAGAAPASAMPARAPEDWCRLVAEINRSLLGIGQEILRASADPLGLSAWLPMGAAGGRHGHYPQAASSWSGLATLFGMPLDNWRRVVSTYSVAPGDMEKAARQPGSPYGPETVHSTLVGFLSMPAIGYTREWQEEVQRWGLLWLDHWQALQAYTGVVYPSVFDALAGFREAIRDPAKGAAARESLRAFYDLWIDCSEDAYGRLSFAPEFIEAQARLSNSVFALKRQEQWMMEEFQSALNMPTRRELDTSHRRAHQLNRRLWQVEQALEEDRRNDRGAELDELRQEIRALQARLDQLPKPAGRPRER